MKIIWKGNDSSIINGLIICELPPITKPKMKTSIVKIDGRDGDIIEELGYESYIKNVKIGLTKDYDINEIIKYFTGKGTLVLSSEPDKEYRCSIIEKIDYEKLLRFKTATIKFYTQPYKYKTNESSVVKEITNESSLTIENVGLENSRPIMKLSGTGIIEISINDVTNFTYSFPNEETEVIIDSDEEEAYFNGVYKNRNMVGDFPILEPGENTLTWTGNLVRIEVQPKSRWI